MDWKIFLATFGAIFFAEMADKTQLVGLTMAAKSQKPWAVWLGSVSAYLIVTAISVLLGMLLSRYLKPEWLKVAGGVIFVVMGVLLLFDKL
ncbi:MAG: TMEM165/GDT1 family protein [Candidatus Omnitrophica bacterium]|nr:TMEM165/GDT1 family protein [Candidatus Omnitrophota bacterium]MDD5573759.1 TMEM165/GDT1 family protein [Candidatus Omnitrophota bacterium]